MKLLFIQGGTRLKKDKDGVYYTDGNFNNNVWNRYKKYCDELLLVLREEEKIYEPSFAKSKFNFVDDNCMTIFNVPDLMRPPFRFFSFKYRKIVTKKIESAIKLCDKAIIRSAHNFYTLTAVRLCKKYNKPYLIEVAGFAFDGYWFHGDLFGKIVALPYELLAKSAMKDADYCVYVTQKALQNRYPCKNKTLGCSDVELYKFDDADLNSRIERLKNNKENKFILGTIGWLNVKFKAQKDVIKVLYNLKKQGFTNFEYQLVGLGNSAFLEKLVKKYELDNCVKIIGPLPHEKVFDWLEKIDIYIHPSYTEGLCRAIVEAMSKACPIIVSDAGGNSELANSKYVFKKRSTKQLEKILKNITNADLIEEAMRSFNKSKEFNKKALDKVRNDFYEMFINE